MVIVDFLTIYRRLCVEITSLSSIINSDIFENVFVGSNGPSYNGRLNVFLQNFRLSLIFQIMNWSSVEVIEWCTTFIREDSILRRFEGEFFRFFFKRFPSCGMSVRLPVSFASHIRVVENCSVRILIFLAVRVLRSSFDETTKRPLEEKC